MDETKRRLENCFQIVFPDLTEQEIPSASQDTVGSWDSVAAITLMNVIEDEFGLEMDLDELADLDSFGKVYGYLQKRLQVA
jgi:acyl carrier protein